MLTELGQRGYTVHEESVDNRVNPNDTDTDADRDPDGSKEPGDHQHVYGSACQRGTVIFSKDLSSSVFRYPFDALSAVC